MWICLNVYRMLLVESLMEEKNMGSTKGAKAT